MNYKSPFHFLPIPAFQQSDYSPHDILRAKKRILAEFELKDDGIESRARANELLQWLDTIKPEELKFHLLIFENKPLLNFLESGKVDGENWFEKNHELKNDPAVRNFVFSLIQKQFDLLFANAFRSGNITKINELSKFYLPELDKKGRLYYASTTTQLSLYYHQLLEITENWQIDKEELLLKFLQQPFFGIFKELPPYFQPIRDEFILCLSQFSKKHFNNTHEQAYVKKAISTTVSKIDNSNQPERSKKLNIKPKKEDIESSNKKNHKKSGRRFVFILAVLLVIIIRIIGIVIGFIIN